MDRISEKVSVIVPCYNEGPKIRRNLSEICEFLNTFAPNHDLIVVDDGSTDDSLSEIRQAASDYPSIRPVHYAENVGKGYALRAGFERASGEYVVILDADLDLHPRQLVRFFETQRRESADVVIGSKRHPDSRVDYPKRRRLISFIYSLFLRVLFDLPVRDTQAGLKLFRREVLERVFSKIVCKRFAFDVELLANAHRLGYKIVEAPVELNFGRVLRQGRMTLADLWNTGWDTLAIYYRMYALHYYDRPHLTPSQFPTVSIVIVATGAEPAVKECVEACLHQNYPSEFEVILVTNQKGGVEENGRLRTREVAEEGKAAKRNQGLDLSRFEVLAFIDAPSTPVKNWLSRAARNFGDPEIAAVSGPRLPSSATIATQLSGWQWLASLFGKRSLRYCYFKTVHANETRCHLDNLIIRKSTLNDISKTSNLLLAFEDKEMASIITRKLKQVIAYDPEVIVFQPDEGDGT